jgi:hypothetical protein
MNAELTVWCVCPAHKSTGFMCWIYCLQQEQQQTENEKQKEQMQTQQQRIIHHSSFII